MSGETIITVIGNLVEDPELRWTSSSVAVAKFRVASTPRTFDRQANEFKDGDSLYLTCSVWRQAAENAAESLQKGMRVIVQGRLKQRSYEDREGVKRTVFEVDVEELGVSLKSATAKVSKTSGSGERSQGEGRQQYDRARQRSSREGLDDPWGNSPAQGGQAARGGWGQPAGGEEPPPF